MSDYIVDGIKSELDNLTWEFEEHNEKFNLDLNSNLIEFSKCHSEFTITPNEWLRSKHKNGKIRRMENHFLKEADLRTIQRLL